VIESPVDLPPTEASGTLLMQPGLGSPGELGYVFILLKSSPYLQRNFWIDPPIDLGYRKVSR